jgi:chromosome segregation ATPase
MIDTCVNKAMDHATTEDLQQPVLLALLDILDSHLQMQGNSDLVLAKLGAESVEGLLHVVDPKNIRVDYMESFYEETQVLSETPPANNLSRMDEKSICFEQEEVKEPRGLDNAVRIAAATFLAKLCYSPNASPDEGVNLLNSRISTAVNDFLIDYQQMGDSLEAICLSLDLNKRIFRLKLSMSTPENEDFVLTMEHTNKKLQQRRFHRLMEENKKIQEQLDGSLSREQQLEKEKTNLKERYHSLSILSKREMSRNEKQATQEARRLVSIHASERSKAESQVSDAIKSAKRREDELREAMVRAEECQKREMGLSEKLQEAVSSAAELERRNNELRQQVGVSEDKLKEIHAELEARTEALNAAEGKCQHLEGQIHHQNEAISGAEDTNEQLRQNLEELFADMSSLAQIYSFKENEETSIKEAFSKEIDEAQRKLEEERRQNEEMATKLEKFKSENQKLFRKLEKYKLKIEEDRREREEETQRRKRNGPVSYINQLHTSNISDKSFRDRSVIRTETSIPRRRDESSGHKQAKSVRKASSSQSRRRDESSSRNEKENSSYYYASAASQARKRS